jgi:hypothetical protein
MAVKEGYHCGEFDPTIIKRAADDNALNPCPDAGLCSDATRPAARGHHPRLSWGS